MLRFIVISLLSTSLFAQSINIVTQTKGNLPVTRGAGAIPAGSNNTALSNVIAAGSLSGTLIQTSPGVNTWDTCPVFGNNSVHLILLPGVITVNTSCVIPSNVTLEFKQGARFAPASGITVTVKGSAIAGTRQRIVDITNGTVTFLGGDAIPVQWYGAKSDAQDFSGSACGFTAGLNTVGVAGGAFTSADIGKFLWVASVGGPGMDANARSIYSMITGVNSATNITIAETETYSGAIACTVGTDSTAAIQGAINANPGRRILLSKSGVSDSGGTGVTSTDYLSSCGVKLSGNGQILGGEVTSQWTGGVNIKFPYCSTGAIRIPPTCMGCKIQNLEVQGSAPWSFAVLRSFIPPPILDGDGGDGIQVLGGEPELDHIHAYNFPRHGIAIIGNNTISDPPGIGQPDRWVVRRSEVQTNRGYGFYIVGGDANVGGDYDMDNRGNMLGGTRDDAGIGTNTHHTPHSADNGRNIIAAGATQAVTSVSVSAGICTLTTVGVLISGVKDINTWVTIAGTSGGTGFDGTFQISGFSVGAQTLTYPCNSSGGPASSGTVRTASSANVYTQIQATYPNDIIGTYVTDDPAEIVFDNPYCEGNQAVPVFGKNTIIIGGNCSPATFATQVWKYGSLFISQGSGTTTMNTNGLILTSAIDNPANIIWNCGLTMNQNCNIKWFSFDRATPLFSLGTNGTTMQMAPQSGGGAISITASGFAQIGGATGVKINNAVSNVDTQFMNNLTTIARIDSTGKGTFNAGIVLGSLAAPTCDASHRGQINYVAGGAGIKDIVQVCAKDAGDTYAWRAIF